MRGPNDPTDLIKPGDYEHLFLSGEAVSQAVEAKINPPQHRKLHRPLGSR